MHRWIAVFVKKKFQIEKGKSREYQDGYVQGISKLKAPKK